MTLLDQLEDRWLRAGVARRPGVPATAIAAFEMKAEISLPRDFADYLRRVDGMEPGQVDDDQFRFWPLGELELVRRNGSTRDADPAGGLLVFADFLIWSNLCAIHVSGNDVGAVSFIGADRQRKIAESFESFLSLYLDQSKRLYGG